MLTRTKCEHVTGCQYSAAVMSSRDSKCKHVTSCQYSGAVMSSRDSKMWAKRTKVCVLKHYKCHTLHRAFLIFGPYSQARMISV